MLVESRDGEIVVPPTLRRYIVCKAEVPKPKTKGLFVPKFNPSSLTRSFGSETISIALMNAYDCGWGVKVRTRLDAVTLRLNSRMKSGLIGRVFAVYATALKLSISTNSLATKLK